jgi:hypothetical protein
MESGSDAALDSSFGCLEEFGDVAVAVATEVREFDRLALARIKGIERGTHRLGLGEIEHLTFDVVECDRPPSVAGFATTPSRLGPEEIDRAPVSDGKEIRTQRSAIRVESFRVTPEPDEHLLHRLFGELPIDEHAAGQAEAGVAMPSIDLRERFVVAVDDGESEFCVAERRQ